MYAKQYVFQDERFCHLSVIQELIAQVAQEIYSEEKEVMEHGTGKHIEEETECREEYPFAENEGYGYDMLGCQGYLKSE